MFRALVADAALLLVARTGSVLADLVMTVDVL